ncbi:MAG TPA: apolipoprotein N-acyltransferase [Syntrophorhabdaceae bacterium]|nr:apolipoprotein N-acyltransferase [Syntrophorhabdaceae bacterium]
MPERIPVSRRISHSLYSYWPSIFTGVLLILIQPPLSVFPLAFFALMPLLSSIDKTNLRRSFISGYITGVVSFFGLIYWVVTAMNHYGGINIVLSSVILLLFVLYLSLYTGLFGLICAWLDRCFTVPVCVSSPLVWILLEYLRGAFQTGFPWSYLAHSQYNFLTLIQVVSVTGSYYISFLIVAVNVVLFMLWRRQKGRFVYASFIGLLFLVTVLYGYISLHRKEAEPNKTTAIVQGNIRQDVKWDEAFKSSTIHKHVQMSIEKARNADLVIWPETAMPFIFDQDVNAKTYLTQLPQALNANLLFGTISRDDDKGFRNSALLIRKNGSISRYDKVHLVPFGEYTPLASYIPFLKDLTAAGGDFTRGAGHTPLTSDAGPVGLLICYEGVFPAITYETVREGAQVLVNLTNDAWYDRTSAPYQHFAFYVFRAIETDRYVLRAANTGISAIIDPKGRVSARTPIFTQEVLKGSFSMKQTKTFYVDHGDYFILITLVILMGASCVGWYRKGD